MPGVPPPPDFGCANLEIETIPPGHLRGGGLIASGPRSPSPGAPYTYVTTKEFLLELGLDTLRDLPDFEALDDAGLLSKERLLAADIPIAIGWVLEDDDEIEGCYLDVRSEVPE